MRYFVINNNLPDMIVNKGDTDSIPFDPQRIVGENYNFENDIYQSLKQILGENRYDAFIISINLDKNNNLEFDGLDIAYTLRLSPGLRHQNTPIIFLGSLSLEQLLRLNQKAAILLTKGVFYFVLDSESGAYIDELKYRDITLQEYIEFIDRINVPSPGNYLTHHSVANEWALIRYFSMIDNDELDDKYIILKRKIADLDYFNTLHFKYSEAHISRQKFNLKKNAPITIIDGIRGKRIGVIDDESIKGWGAFYDYWLSKSGAEIILFEKFEKGKPKESLIKEIKTWIDGQNSNSTICDAYIIDLRLHDDDFYNTNVDNLSGMQVAEYIRKIINPGIQIVISTASNKVWNYQKCIENGITSFVVKESPETNNTKEETRKSLVYFNREICKAVQKSYLADIYSVILNLKSRNVFSGKVESEEFNGLVFSKNGILDQIFNLLNLDDKNDSILNQCLILCFHILENYFNLGSICIFSFESGKPCGCDVIMKDGTIEDVFLYNAVNEQLKSRFKFISGNFPFQNDISQRNTTEIELFSESKSELNFKLNLGLDVRFLIKMISVLKYRDFIEKEELERLIKLRYYRSNVAAHLTGNINLEVFKLRSDDIRFFISLFVKIFK